MRHVFLCGWNSLFSFSASLLWSSTPALFASEVWFSILTLSWIMITQGVDHSSGGVLNCFFFARGIRFTTFSLSKPMLSDLQNSSQNVQEHWRCEVEWLVNDTSGAQLKLQICVVLPVRPAFLWAAQQSLGNRKSAGKGSQCHATWTVLYCNLFLKS